MAKVAKKKNDKHAPSLANLTLKIIQRVLVLVGTPLYFLLSSIFAFLFFVCYQLGSLIILGSKKLKKTLKPLPKRKARKIQVQQDWTQVKLKILRLRLFLFKVFPKKLPSFEIKTPRLNIYLKTFLLTIFIISVAGFIFWYKILKDLPSVSSLVQTPPQVSTKIYDRHGELLYKIYRDQNRSPISLESIPEQVKLATIAIEDAEFYNHPGFSLKGMTRAILQNIRDGDLSGGSTITQQLVKNTLLSPEKTLSRKVKELILSVEVELTYSKNEILEMYLNEVSYGGTAYGIEEASEIYFDKKVGELTLGEAALLAGLSKSPSKYSPFTDSEAALQRQKEVLNLMVVNKFITPEIEQVSLRENIQFAKNEIDIKAPHFVMYTRQLLAEKYGEDMLETGGLEVTTTLDLEIQEMAQRALTEEVAKLKGLRVGNAAAVVINPKTGDILAMVGSKDYFNQKEDGNVNVTIRPRQPGSSIKIVNYAYALSHGFTPVTMIDDSAITYKIPGSPIYSPKNYDGRFRGPLSLRSALAESRNIPAVKILASYGVNKMIDLGRQMGITTWNNPSRFGLSLTLGGGEVRLLDLAQVYATVANYGKRPEVGPIISVKNYKGKVLEKGLCKSTASLIDVLASETPPSECKESQVLDPRVAYQLIDILKDNNARSPAFGRSSQLVIPGRPEIAVKTGTSNDLKDNLTIGFNQDYVVAVWVGNNDGSPMSKVASGITGAAPIWNRIMTNLVSSKPSTAWTVPTGLVQTSVCSLTGTLSCSGCPGKQEYFLKESVPQRSCSQELVEKIKKQIAERSKQPTLP